MNNATEEGPQRKATGAECTSLNQSKDVAVAAVDQDPNPFRLFVGGISFTVDEGRLRKDFSSCGKIADLNLQVDKMTGDSKGFMFITMADKAGFDAVLKFDKKVYAKRKLHVSKANSIGFLEQGVRRFAKGAGLGAGRGPGEKPEGCTSVVVKGLSYEVTKNDLEKVFAKCGDGPSNVKLLTDKETGQSRGMAFVDFHTGKAVDAAMKLSETMLKGRAFFMDYAKPLETW